MTHVSPDSVVNVKVTFSNVTKYVYGVELT